jgi:hypothetical protein
MTSVPLVTFNELEPAQALRERLQQAGISATIHDESKLERFWFMSPPHAAIHIEVPQSQYLEARQLIAVWDTEEGLLRQAVRCPDCRSSRIEFPQITRKFITPTVARLFMSLHVIPQEFYCLDCHYTWPLKVPVERKLDILGFPEDSKFWHPPKPRREPRI